MTMRLRAPTPEWKGRSKLNLCADFVMETDAVVGRELKALNKTGKALCGAFYASVQTSPQTKQ
jgi:hypothetical protein